METSHSHLLSEAQHQIIFEEHIKPQLFDHVKPAQQPIAVIFGGQPGSGKSMTLDLRYQTLIRHGGAALIIGDDLRGFHPDYEYLMEKDDRTAASYTDADTGRWIEKAIQYAKTLRCHVAIEGTMRVPWKVAFTMKLFREAGYKIEAHVLAVNQRLSWQGILQRYEYQRAVRKSGRMTLQQSHDSAYDNLPITLHKIETEKLADTITLYKRGGIILYENEMRNNFWLHPPKACVVLENERARLWTLMECQEYAKNYDKLFDLLLKPDRHATLGEIQTIEKLREEAHLELASHAHIKITSPEISSNEEAEFKKIIHHYKKLRKTRDQDPLGRYSYHQETLQKFAYQMNQNHELMQYVKKHFTRIAKNVKLLSKYQKQALDFEIT